MRKTKETLISEKSDRVPKRTILSIICCAVLLLTLASVITCFFIKNSRNPDGERGFVTLKGTKRIDGQNCVFEIINYQRFYDTIDKKGEFVNHTDNNLPLSSMSSAVTTKENETYMVFQNFETEDGSNTTFTLYRLQKSGWKALTYGEVSNNFLPTYAQFWSAPIYIIADKESNIHVVALLDDMIIIYDYDKENNIFIKRVSPCNFGKINQLKGFSTYYDEKDGESGTIYVACALGGVFTFVKYDVAANAFDKISKVSLGTHSHLHKFAVSGGVIYLIAMTGYGQDSRLSLYTIHDAFGPKKTFKSTTLFDVKKAMSENADIYDIGISVGRSGTSNDGLYVDSDGNINIIASKSVRHDRDERPKTALMYFKADSDGNILSTDLERLCNGENLMNNYFGGFVAVGDDHYYVELYDGALNTVAIGKITDGGKTELVDVFKLPNGVNKNNGFMIKTNGQNVIFYSMENWNIYFFQIKN